MSKSLTILTLARKGSTRYPDKVRKKLFGVPLYMYTVMQAHEIQKHFNCHYYFAHDYDNLWLPNHVIEIIRKKSYAGDKHQTCEEIKSFNINTEWYILLQCTSPIRDIDKIIKKIEMVLLFEKNHCDAVFSACRMKPGYYYDENQNRLNFNVKERTDNGCLKNNVYKETGSFYMFHQRQLEKGHILESNRIEILEDDYNIDIDTREDLKEIERRIKTNED